ncbi:MAG: DUF4058 family protein [Chloroflexota bacterium]
MPSPFPGMNPYLERANIWEDFHQSLASEIRDQLAAQIEPNYYAALSPRLAYDEVYIGEISPLAPSNPPRSFVPDVGIVEQASWQWQIRGGVVLDPAPLSDTIPMPLETPIKLWAIELRTVDLGILVTSIEILSPINKRLGTAAFDAYHAKRTELIRAGVNFLEIDLLRAGKRFPTQHPLPNAPYFVFLSRQQMPDQIYIWPLNLRERIPLLPVPLRDPDPDAVLDLGKAIHDIYDRARYARRINYAEPPPKPDFSPDDQHWLAALVNLA